jgi:hypothetical protein
MRTAAATFIVIGLAATAGLDAQGRGRKAQGIPPGHLPPAGQCRVWYDSLPPGRQPAPTSCDRAEQLASRDRDARVIYGDRDANGNESWRTTDDYRTGGSPLGDQIRERIRNRNSNGTTARNNSVAYNTGSQDGYEKGREDADDNDSYDPVRHSRYRSADRGYNSSYGTREAYKLTYRDGFEAGYERGYREVKGYSTTRNRAGALR